MASLEDFSNGLTREEIGDRIQRAIDEAPGQFRGNDTLIAGMIGKNPDTLKGYISGKHEVGAITMWRIARVTGKPYAWFAGEGDIEDDERQLDEGIKRMLRHHKSQLIRQIEDIDSALGKQ